MSYVETLSPINAANPLQPLRYATRVELATWVAPRKKAYQSALRAAARLKRLGYGALLVHPAINGSGRVY